MLYRLLTENVNYKDVIATVSAKFDGFTVLRGNGYWQGQVEHCLVIEIIAAESFFHTIESICYDIKKLNSQQAVMVQIIECKDMLL